VSEAETLACRKSDHDAQADLDALGAFGLFQPTVQHVDGSATFRPRRSRRPRLRQRRLRGGQHGFGQGGEVGRSVRHIGDPLRPVWPCLRT
jgi:hypothetical protein